MRTAIKAVLLILLLAIGGAMLYAHETNPWQKKLNLETPHKMNELAIAENRLKNWPPELNSKFPELQLVDHTGSGFDLAKLAGKPTLVEIVAMSCAGCQAYSGGNKVGAYGGFPAQREIQSIEEYYERFTGGLKLFDGQVNFVQIIIYNLKLEPTGPEDLAKWRQHFGFDQRQNTYILSGGKALANGASFKMIPGFFLLDKDLIVRFDATGHHPKHNVYTQLLPAVRAYLRPS
jgi:hypothetical protein